MKVPFGDLRRQYDTIKDEIDSAISRVIERGWFVLGKEVEQFEREFAEYLGVKHVVGVGSGTEAIHLALLALGVEPGDEVITVANTCVPTVSAVSFAGAKPVLVDIDPKSFTLAAEKIGDATTARTKAILPVHMYGRAADMAGIIEIGKKKGIPVIEDTAQGHGARYQGRRLGALGDAGCFSFYPSKNLGCYGDGGAVATNDSETASRLKRLRNYGEERRYFHTTKGFNSRLDEIQAAILRAKLPFLDQWNQRRREIALLYEREIVNPIVEKPTGSEDGAHCFHLYVIRCRRRDELQKHLTVCGIGSLIHYPVPIHLQEAYSDLNKHPGDFPVSEKCSSEVLSLPIYPELTDEECRYVASCINAFE